MYRTQLNYYYYYIRNTLRYCIMETNVHHIQCTIPVTSECTIFSILFFFILRIKLSWSISYLPEIGRNRTLFINHRSSWSSLRKLHTCITIFYENAPWTNSRCSILKHSTNIYNFKKKNFLTPPKWSIWAYTKIHASFSKNRDWDTTSLSVIYIFWINISLCSICMQIPISEVMNKVYRLLLKNDQRTIGKELQ